MISANGGLPAHRYTPQVTPRWPRGSEPASVLLVTGDTLGQAIPLSHVHHMAMGPRLSDTKKQRHPLAQRGARDLWPADLNALGPNRALLHLTMKPMAQLLSALAGEKHFIVEGHTDNIMSPAANTLADAIDAWDEARGHPAERNAQDVSGPNAAQAIPQTTLGICEQKCK